LIAPAAAIAGGSAAGTRETIMTRQAGFKRRVRARMAKTGESYAAARSGLLTHHPSTVPDDSGPGWMAEALHVSNGDATDVPGTGLARQVIYWRDVLHEGPVPDVAPAELRRIRASYLTSHYKADHGETIRQFAERDEAIEANRDGQYVMGDITYFHRMEEMARGPHPLLRLDPPGRPVERTTGVRLTDTGARVLAGQADQIALNGTDRWIGGVHLQGHHVPWRWDNGTETIVAPT
jgi:hypothetical protein